MKNCVDRCGRSAYGAELTMKNVNSEGKFVIPAFPQKRDLAELLVFLTDGNPEIKLEVARNHGVLIRGIDEFLTTCAAGDVSFRECPIEHFAAWLVSGGPGKLVSRRGTDWQAQKRNSPNYRTITLWVVDAQRMLGEVGLPVQFAEPANVMEV